MKLTEEEKKVFIEYGYGNRGSDIDFLAEIFLNAYEKMDNYDDLKVACNCLKKMILEYSKEAEYDIQEEITFDIDEILNGCIKVLECFVGFKVEYFKDEQKMNKYFDLLTADMTSEEVDDLRNPFIRMSFGLLKYLQNYIVGIDSFINDLDDELYGKKQFYSSIMSCNIDVAEEDEDIMIWDTDGEVVDRDIDAANCVNEEINLLPKEKLEDYLGFISVLFDLIKCNNLRIDIGYKLTRIYEEKKLNEFYSDKDFCLKFDAIMNHDVSKSALYFHGTQCLESADSILCEGLGIARNDLSTTSYREFTKDRVIVYERGFDGTIGQEAVVIIDVPIDENGRDTNVIKSIKPGYKIHFCPSGLQGFNMPAKYIIYPENIVGYVDKVNKDVIFNPKYRNYDKFREFTNGLVENANGDSSYPGVKKLVLEDMQ